MPFQIIRPSQRYHTYLTLIFVREMRFHVFLYVSYSFTAKVTAFRTDISLFILILTVFTYFLLFFATSWCPCNYKMEAFQSDITNFFFYIFIIVISLLFFSLQNHRTTTTHVDRLLLLYCHPIDNRIRVLINPSSTKQRNKTNIYIYKSI